MNIIFKKVFKFDLENLLVVPFPISTDENDFEPYLNELIEDIIDDTRSRKYLFPEDATGIKTVINEVLEKRIDDATLSTAKRLLRIEQLIQKQIEKLNQEVQKGILLQSLVEFNGQNLFIITKSEHLDFINENDNRRTKGLPVKKKIFKSFCAYLDENNKPIHALVNDSKQSISKYWWSDFLELLEEYTDSYNTAKAFDALDKKIFQKIKPRHPEDYMYLRNTTVQYFRSNDEFVLEDYINSTIRTYVPVDESLQMPQIEQRILSLPADSGFNGRFNIIREEIKKRIINNIRLTPQLLLEINGSFDWENTVTAYEKDGAKYIEIRTDEGYKYFKKQQDI